MMKRSSLALISKSINGIDAFKFEDKENNVLQNSRVKRVLERYRSYFYDFDNYILKDNLNYILLQDLIDKVNNVLIKIDQPLLDISDDIKQFINENEYAINEQKIAGSTIKSNDSRWNYEFDNFRDIISEEISRPLKEQQIQSSFYLATMKRAANFSVPGAGKTAMMYGAFAYLSSPKIHEIKRIVVVCPLNAFEAWRTEFIEVFGAKRVLTFMNLRDSKYRDIGKVRIDWGTSNIIVINYESLGSKLRILNELICHDTMIVFDEVHRVKGIGGSRAKVALELGVQAKYHYVLTGTPIPNSYKDVYNFLHLLYNNEYDTYFGWEISDLEQPAVDRINEKIYPFFWRTNKKDLMVPEAEPDKMILVSPNSDQQILLQAIYENEKSVLALYIRLLQASTNPSILLDKINYQDLGLLEDEIDFTQFNALNDEEHELARINAYKKLNIESISSPKFDEGINLIVNLVSEGKKVIVWAMFVKTMHKIKKVLKSRGVSVNLVYGNTPKDERVDLIDEFRDGNIEVLVSNPNTLGESISLHQTVHDAVYFEYNFNLTFMLQSRDRIHRLGLMESQYTRYYYLMTQGSRAEGGFIDIPVYKRLKEKEKLMFNAIDGEILMPEITDSYLDDVKKIISNE